MADTVQATAKFVRVSPRKARLVADHIRGRSVPEARTILAFTERAAAVDVEKVLRSAVANAEHNHQVRNLDDLRVVRAIADRGIDYVAQEAVTLSTMPVWRGSGFAPRPFSLRLFLAKGSEGWHVMPGGFVRIADDIDARAVSLQHGGRTADSWVLSDGPVGETTLLPRPERIVIKRTSGVLPSRAMLLTAVSTSAGYLPPLPVT